MNDTITCQGLNKDILFELDKFKVNSVKKRLKNELNEIAKTGAFIHTECTIDKQNNSIISITIVLENDNNLYKFYVTKEYPFRPPRFEINYKDYKQYLIINSIETKNELKKYNKMNCLCCHSISCGENWSPAITLHCFINEHKKNKKLRRNIINCLLAKKIINKYLYPNANLFEWLF